MRQTQPVEAGWRGMRRLLNIRWQAFILSRDSGGECFSSLRAVAKQSSAQCKPPLDCFVASAPRNDERSRSRDAVRARGTLHASRKVPRTKAREAERRMAHPVPIAAPERGAAAAQSGTARLPALHCGSGQGFHTLVRLGPRFLESPDPNGRTLSGASAASTSQTTTRWWTGRCPSRLQAKSDELRPQEPHPLRQSASPVDVPHEERAGRCYSNRRGGVKGIISCPFLPIK
jgi:hypothetical protein